MTPRRTRKKRASRRKPRREFGMRSRNRETRALENRMGDRLMRKLSGDFWWVSYRRLVSDSRHFHRASTLQARVQRRATRRVQYGIL